MNSALCGFCYQFAKQITNQLTSWQVAVAPNTVAETVSILRGLRPKYESHHDVKISDAALVAAAQLSERYLADRVLPDKAIDLVDEATSKVRMEASLKPEAVDRLERRIGQLESERKGLVRSALLYSQHLCLTPTVLLLFWKGGT